MKNMVVGYCRLSRDDNQKNIASIETQKDIIRSYALSLGWVVSKFYVDDNYSGYKIDEDDDTMFDRPAFKELWEQVTLGKIKAILIKDLTRLGRNNAIIQIIIKRLSKAGVSLIDIDERKDITSVEDDFLPIKAWQHEQYVKDISRKTRSNMYSKQQLGKLIMGKFYGYTIKDKIFLIVDELIRPCIELIFELYIDGFGYAKVADYLNEKTAFPTPSQYYASKAKENGKKYIHKVTSLWQSYHIQTIIASDVYIGILRTHKKETKSIRGYAVKLPIDQHFIFENHHEPIINKDDWSLAQEIRKKRDKNDYRGSAKNDYLFKGFTVCGECGYHVSGLMIRRRKGNVPGYNCSMFSRYGTKVCSSKEIKEEELLNHFKAFLMDTKKAFADYLLGINVEKKSMDNSMIKTLLEKELRKIENELKVLLDNKIQDIIRQPEEYRLTISETYDKLEKEKLQRKIDIQNQLKTLSEQPDKTEATIRTYIDVMDEIISSERPTRKLLETIIDNIIFHKGKNTDFKLKVDLKDINAMN